MRATERFRAPFMHDATAGRGCIVAPQNSTYPPPRLIYCIFEQYKIMRHTTFRPPLTAAELRDIGLRRDPADIVRLLWEIKRLRAIALRAHQYEQSAYGGTGGSLLVLNALRRELEGEPVVSEQGSLADLRERQDRGPRGGDPDR